MDRTIGLLGLGTYVPARIMENDEWGEHVDTSDQWIRERTGIERRRIAAADESTVDLAYQASIAALADAKLEIADIDEIIVATDTPELYIPDTSAILQHRLGAREVPCFDLAGSGCAGWLLALDVARARVLCGTGKVLVVGVELLTRLMSWEDRSTCVLFGDGAGAAVVGSGASAVMLSAVAGTDGSKAGILCLEAGGTRLPFEVALAAGVHKKVVMHGPEVFKVATKRMSAACKEALDKAGVALEEVAWLVPHQANLRIINAVGKRLGIDPAKVVINVQNFGNTGSASVPLALAEACADGRIGPGDKVLLTSFGAGFHWGAMLLQY